MAMIRLTFFVPTDVLERYDALVYRSGVKRSQLLREALEHGLAGVRAALPRLRARYGDDRRPRRRGSVGGVDAGERAEAANVQIERRLERVGRMLVAREPDITAAQLRAALGDSCDPKELWHEPDEVLDRVVARVLGDSGAAAPTGVVPLKIRSDR